MPLASSRELDAASTMPLVPSSDPANTGLVRSRDPDAANTMPLRPSGDRDALKHEDAADTRVSRSRDAVLKMALPAPTETAVDVPALGRETPHEVTTTRIPPLTEVSPLSVSTNTPQPQPIPITPRPGVIAVGLVVAALGLWLAIGLLPGVKPLAADHQTLDAEDAAHQGGGFERRLNKEAYVVGNVMAVFLVVVGLSLAARGALYRSGAATDCRCDKSVVAKKTSFGLRCPHGNHSGSDSDSDSGYR
jgi:hypothetical protein